MGKQLELGESKLGTVGGLYLQFQLGRRLRQKVLLSLGV